MAAVGFVKVADIAVSPKFVSFLRVIPADGQAGRSREICGHVFVALAVPIIVRTGAQIVETSLAAGVVISADIRAGFGRFGGGIIPKAPAVSVVGISASRRLVIAVAVAVKSADIVAGTCGIVEGPSGVTLSVDAVRAAVVLVEETGTVLVVTSDVLASAAR